MNWVAHPFAKRKGGVSLVVASERDLNTCPCREADDVVCTPATMLRLAVTLALFSSTALHAQQPAPPSMGTIPTRDALVTGGLEVHGDTARLLTNASVTAYDHPAAISLARGGEALVCATSQFHLLHSGTENSLLFSLDRGAIELHTDSSPQDVILTPDIRFTIEHAGHFDLRLRVTPNGDTCVENRGTSAPVLSLADPFSGAAYRLIPGQHVLFEHGNLHEVVDNERSPCGCPPAAVPAQQVASAPQSDPKSDPSQPTTPTTAAAEHPFPAAASQGLAPTPSPAHTPTPAGQQQTQVATTLSYDAAHPNAVPPSTVEPPKPPPTTGSTTGSPTGTGDSTSATPPPTPPGAHDIFHSIGHFFHKIFRHENKPATPTQ